MLCFFVLVCVFLKRWGFVHDAPHVPIDQKVKKKKRSAFSDVLVFCFVVLDTRQTDYLLMVPLFECIGRVACLMLFFFFFLSFCLARLRLFFSVRGEQGRRLKYNGVQQQQQQELKTKTSLDNAPPPPPWPFAPAPLCVVSFALVQSWGQRFKCHVVRLILECFQVGAG